jgi:2'-5' RNA ligase
MLFALVTYLPEPLGPLLNGLREELVPGCHLRSHITVLPPRTLASRDAAWRQLQRDSAHFSPIWIDLDEIQVFPETSVVYLSVAEGSKELKGLHKRLSQGALAFNEPFEFTPHVTLAQGLTGESAVRAAEIARRRWASYRGPRGFLLDSMTFVESARTDQWSDLGELFLDAVAAR